jgi:hypothetical protein
MPALIAPSPITAMPLPGLPESLLAIAKPSAAEIEKEEQAVYSFFFAKAKGPVLILQDTATNISSDDPAQTMKYIKSNLKEVSNETARNYLARNEKPSQLSPNMDLGDLLCQRAHTSWIYAKTGAPSQDLPAQF